MKKIPFGIRSRKQCSSKNSSVYLTGSLFAKIRIDERFPEYIVSKITGIRGFFEKKHGFCRRFLQALQPYATFPPRQHSVGMQRKRLRCHRQRSTRPYSQRQGLRTGNHVPLAGIRQVQSRILLHLIPQRIPQPFKWRLHSICLGLAFFRFSVGFRFILPCLIATLL